MIVFSIRRQIQFMIYMDLLNTLELPGAVFGGMLGQMPLLSLRRERMLKQLMDSKCIRELESVWTCISLI